MLTASANADRIDAYPIINWPGDPIPNVNASYSFHDDDQGWVGTIGVIHPDAAPSSIISINAGYTGMNTSSFPFSNPGRVPGVYETTVTNGNTTLAWKVGDIPVVVSGDNIDLMYQLVDLVQPTETTSPRAGYQFRGPLPDGLTELETPYHRIAMRTPSLLTNDGSFGVAVEQGPLLNTLAGGGYTKLDTVTVNGLYGFKSATGYPTIGLALSTDETLYIYSQSLTMEQLTNLAENVTITDEASWRTSYELTD